MSRATTFTVLAGFVVGGFIGCGPSKPSEESGVPPSGKTGESVKPLTKEKVFRTSADLFAGMPKEAYPKSGPGAGIERAAALDWFKENIVGHSVEWTAKVDNPQVEGDTRVVGDGPPRFKVTFDTYGVTHHIRFGLFPGRDCVAWKDHTLGSQTCEVLIDLRSDIYLKYLTYGGCTVDEAKHMRTFGGKDVTFRARIKYVEVSDRGTSSDRREDDPTHVTFFLTVSPAAINGFLPEAMMPKQGGK